MLAREEKLTEIVRRLQEAAGDNLQSVVLYGSAARGDFHAHKSDLNLLCVLKSAKVQELARIAGVIRWWSGQLREPAPRIFTKEELSRSADVFAIELLDIGQHHRVLLGSDPIEGIEVPMNLHRVQLEHELRTALQKLRAHFLHSSDNEAQLREIYAQSISSISVLLRHFLIALGADSSLDKSAIYRRIEEFTGPPAADLELGLPLRNNHPPTQIFPAYANSLKPIKLVTHPLDALVPKREWQRAKKQEFSRVVGFKRL